MKEMTERRSIRKYKELEVNRGVIIDIIKAEDMGLMMVAEDNKWNN